MKPAMLSLRLRLLLLILPPLVLMAIMLGYWRYSVAKGTAEILFDRTLLATALAISRDVEISEGDSLSLATRDLMRDVANSQVFYHVTGPGGIYVTGYAYPPVSRNHRSKSKYIPEYFNSVYREESVRVIRISEPSTVGGISGDSTVTVWQKVSSRISFARSLAARTGSVLSVLLVTLLLVVWFAVQQGLRPLRDLEDAISSRSPNDLNEIRRTVPKEVRSVVSTLNRLFAQLQKSMSVQQSFISDAAHQLRNPAAAVLSMAEAAQDATNDADRKQRVDELVNAARNSSRITEQLLSLDRLRQSDEGETHEKLELGKLVETVCADSAAVILDRGITFEWQAPGESLYVKGDELFLSEALKNLFDNALKHGGESLSTLLVKLTREGTMAIITVANDGINLSSDDQERAFRRFGQINTQQGSGLGLAIVDTIAERHGGSLNIDDVSHGASLSLRLPLVV